MVNSHPEPSILAITLWSHAIPNQFIQILKALLILHRLVYNSKSRKTRTVF